MEIRKYFIASSYLLLGIGFVMVSATRHVEAAAMAIFALVVVAGLLVDLEILEWSLSQGAANKLMLIGLPALVLEWQVLGVSPITTIIHFILFTTSLKLLRRKTSRDWLWLYVVSFCQVLMTAGMMVGTSFFLLLLAYLFAAIATLIGFEIRRSQAFLRERRRAVEAAPDQVVEYWKDSGGSRRQLDAPGWGSITWFSAVSMLLILAISVPIFLAMPRINRNFSRNGLLATETLSGFSDTVRLGDVAQIKLNPQVVMRVRVKFPNSEPPHSLRWRGVTLDFYDGRTWSESGTGPGPLKRVGESYRVEEKRSPYGFTLQRFFLEPLNISTIFAAPRPVIVTGLPDLTRDQGGGLWTEPHPFHKLEYNVYSDTSVPGSAELQGDNSRVYPPEIRQRYLQQSPNHDRRVEALAAEVTRGASTQIEMVELIERHLRENYSYSLDLRRTEEGDPVADFLFNTKTGHCEYFASAMVLMLRSRRIPARLVNGFQMGEYNPAADVYTVRQSDAHSWVEVYFPRSGWLSFDPTPPSGLSVYDEGILAMLRQYGEALEMFWLENVIGFDTGKQFSMALSFQRWISAQQRESSFHWLAWVSEVARRIDSWQAGWNPAAGEFFKGGSGLGRLTFIPRAALAVLLLAAIGAAGLLLSRGRSSWKSRLGRDSQASAVAFYQEMLHSLRRAGYVREPHQTPSEFSARVANPDVSLVTDLYLRARFSGRPLTGDEAAAVRRSFAAIRKIPSASGGKKRLRFW